MNKFILSLLVILSLQFTFAEEGHDHHEDEVEEHHTDEPAEENPSIGPRKGITVFDEKKGFKLSEEAVKNFAIKTIKLPSGDEWIVPATAVLYSGEEINLYRIRNGFYKRVDFKTLKKSDKEFQVKSQELQAGDQIVTEGVGFLRAADIVASGGAPHGHSH